MMNTGIKTTIALVCLHLAAGQKHDEYPYGENGCYQGIYPRMNGKFQGSCLELSFCHQDTEGCSNKDHFHLSEESEYTEFSGQSKAHPDFFTEERSHFDGHVAEYSICSWLFPASSEISHHFDCVEENVDGSIGIRRFKAIVDTHCRVNGLRLEEEDVAGSEDIEKCELHPVKKFTEVHHDHKNLYPKPKGHSNNYHAKEHAKDYGSHEKTTYGDYEPDYGHGDY